MIEGAWQEQVTRNHWELDGYQDTFWNEIMDFDRTEFVLLEQGDIMQTHRK